MKDEKDLSAIITVNFLSIDLNCLLYHLELALNKQNEAERRRQTIHKYMQSSDLKCFH
jgi:neutral trehalase